MGFYYKFDKIIKTQKSQTLGFQFIQILIKNNQILYCQLFIKFKIEFCSIYSELIVALNKNRVLVNAKSIKTFIRRLVYQIKQNIVSSTEQIQCLVYSKTYNNFISSAGNQTIKCWKQLNSFDWISSQPYSQHIDFIICIILNTNEDFLFSGNCDKSIKVWKVNFNNNLLTYMYSLEKHNNYVTATSLNQSEAQLVSCPQDKNQIQFGKDQDNISLKSNILDRFVKDNQFIWITGGKEIDKLHVFELKEGVFQENQKKTIQLIVNDQISDECRFPIVFKKERNLIVVRHQTYIYIIRVTNDGQFKIDDQLNFDKYWIYGNITNNEQYLVCWDDKKEGYSSYEILNN